MREMGKRKLKARGEAFVRSAVHIPGQTCIQLYMNSVDAQSFFHITRGGPVDTAVGVSK